MLCFSFSFSDSLWPLSGHIAQKDREVITMWEQAGTAIAQSPGWLAISMGHILFYCLL